MNIILPCLYFPDTRPTLSQIQVTKRGESVPKKNLGTPKVQTWREEFFKPNKLEFMCPNPVNPVGCMELVYLRAWMANVHGIFNHMLYV